MFKPLLDAVIEREGRLADKAHDHHSQQPARNPQSKPMSMMGDYLLKLLERCSDEQFGQDAVQFGITSGAIQLTYRLEADLRLIMGEPGKPETGKYDELCANWREVCRDNNEQLVESYIESGIMEEILRPTSFAQQLGRVSARDAEMQTT